MEWAGKKRETLGFQMIGCSNGYSQRAVLAKFKFSRTSTIAYKNAKFRFVDLVNIIAL
jgi:hypothetical protein